MQEGKDHFEQRARVSGKYLVLIVLCDFNWQTKNKEWLTFGYMLCIAFALCKWNGQFLFVNWTQFELAGGMRGALHIVHQRNCGRSFWYSSSFFFFTDSSDRWLFGVGQCCTVRIDVISLSHR